MLERLAREMNLKLPGQETLVTYPLEASTLSAASDTSDADANWSRLSISDTLLTQDADDSAASAASYAKDFSYLSKPPPAYPRKGPASPAPAPADSATAAAAAAAASPRRSKVRRALSRSHPDLSKLGKELGTFLILI